MQMCHAIYKCVLFCSNLRHITNSFWTWRARLNLSSLTTLSCMVKCDLQLHACH